MEKEDMQSEVELDNSVDETQIESVEESRPIDDQEVKNYLDGLMDGNEDRQNDDTDKKPVSGEAEELTKSATPINAQPETPEQEEAEILQEIKSERGQNRIRELFNERKELREVNQGIIDIVNQANMTSDAWANTLEYSRLASSQNENDWRRALQMLDEQRAVICKRLGEAAPGIDPLEDHPDLRQRVEEMEIPADVALEMAKLRHNHAQQQMSAQQQQTFQMQMQQRAESLQAFNAQANAFAQQRSTDPDFRAKERRLEEYFRKPGVLESFINDYAPHQWLKQLEFLYDNISIPQKVVTQPLRSRPRNMGNANSSQSGTNYLNSVIDGMGI